LNPNPRNPNEKPIIYGFKDKIMGNPIAMSAFLNWLLVGAAKACSDIPMQIPQCVLDATTNYRKEQDIYTQFIADKLENVGSTNSAHVTPVKQINDAFRDWCKDEMNFNVPAPKTIASNFQRLLGASKCVKLNGFPTKCYLKCTLIPTGSIVGV